MTEFVRFPRTPHLVWLGRSEPRDDKVLSLAEVTDFLAGDVVVEEKLDGTNIGISAVETDMLRVQSRGSYISLESPDAQFKPLPHWLRVRRQGLIDALGSRLILFGEWCYARHTLLYDHLPDWFVAFDVFDRLASRFWSVDRRDRFVSGLDLPKVPHLAEGRFNLRSIQQLLGQSQFGNGPAEGVYIRRDREGFLEARAKLVRPEFTQSIGEHWRRREMTPNQIAGHLNARLQARVERGTAQTQAGDAVDGPRDTAETRQRLRSPAQKKPQSPRGHSKT